MEEPVGASGRGGERMYDMCLYDMAAVLGSSLQLWFPGQGPPKVKSFSTPAGSTN